MSVRTSPPGDSRGGPLTTDRPTAEDANHSDEGKSKFTAQRTTTVGQNFTRHTGPVHVFAHGYLVVGTRERCRLVMIVPRCPFCQGRPHVHNGKPSFTVGRRTASCHGGTYLVHLGTVEGELAA